MLVKQICPIARVVIDNRMIPFDERRMSNTSLTLDCFVRGWKLMVGVQLRNLQNNCRALQGMALDFLAGCAGGCAGVIVGHPFDTVKVRLQIQSGTNPMYRGTLDCFVQIIKKESVLGLYKGIASPLYGLAAINAIVFGVQRNMQRCMTDSLGSHFIAGSVAGLCQSGICSPMELAKTRMQIQGQGESLYKFRHSRHNYTGPVDCLRKIFHAEGFVGLCRGLGLTCMRETPSFGMYFLSYEFMLQTLHKNEEEEVSTPVLLFAGGLAGICAWVVSYPIDVVKSKVQADMTNRYQGAWDCFRQTYNAYGIKGFSKGLCSTLLRAFPVNAATFTTVALVLRWMKLDKVDDAYLDMADYRLAHHPPRANVHLSMIANFPSHP